MDRLICLNNALWSVNSMLNSEDPTQWYSKVVRIEKVGFPWACLNSSWIEKSISDFITWIKVNASGQIRSAADYIGGGIETGPQKTHLFNTHDITGIQWWYSQDTVRVHWSTVRVQFGYSGIRREEERRRRKGGTFYNEYNGRKKQWSW